MRHRTQMAQNLRNKAFIWVINLISSKYNSKINHLLYAGENEKVKTKNKKRRKKTGNKNKTKPAFLIYFTVTLSVVKNQKLRKTITQQIQ